MTFLKRLFSNPRERLRPLYDAVVAEGRDPFWYRDGGVPDTVDGRFDMIASVLAVVLLRLEAGGAAAEAESVMLTELFIDDMDGTLRQVGIGDVVVGKHVGKMLGALGGRLGAYRDALAGSGDLGEAVRRNIFRDSPPSEEAVAIVAERLRRLHEKLGTAPVEPILAGELPQP